MPDKKSASVGKTEEKMDARYKAIDEAIEKAIFALLKRKRYDDFTVKDICAEAGINRSTFYAHFQDINDVMIKVEQGIAKKMKAAMAPIHEVGATSSLDERSFASFFAFVRDNKDFYNAFLRENVPSFLAPEMLQSYKEVLKKISLRLNLRYTDREINYHLIYFGGGLRSMCKFWILDNCKETPEEMAKTVYNEYANNARYVTKD